MPFLPEVKLNGKVLLVFPFLAAWFGLAYVFGGPARTSAPSFDAAKWVMSIPQWGAVYLTGALILSLAVAFREPVLIAVALFLGGFIYVFWSVLFAIAAFQDPRASLTGSGIHLAIAFFHFLGCSRVATYAKVQRLA